MGEVVSLQPPERTRSLWRCNCGCFTHYAHEDGSIECAACYHIANGYTGEWRVHLPEAPEAPAEIEPGDTTVIDLDSAEVVLRRMLKGADPAQMAALVIVRKDGSLSMWGEDFDAEGAAWLHRKLDEAAASFTKADETS